MNKRMIRMLPLYAMVLISFYLIAVSGNHAVTTYAENQLLSEKTCIVIDPGHGGEDGGAISCTGVSESQLNLEISLRLNDLLHLLGYRTKMIREADISVYTKGETLSEKKVSDLRHRVKLVEETQNALLLSIHQNDFPESRYSGAQVFYGTHPSGRQLAENLRKAFADTVNPGTRRREKKAAGVYLMEKVSCPAVLVECGFLSNPEEEAKLRTESYQKQISCVIAATVSRFLSCA